MKIINKTIFKMENGSLSQLKLQFNNEVIKMQPFIMQAKIQTINNLAKKIKLLKNKKGSDEQKEKNKKKAESLVSEIMMIKALKRNDLGRFAICNIKEVDKIINTPVVSKDRAMARVLMHKSIKQRFIDLKTKYSDIPTARLLEQDPKKINRKKRKEKLKSKNKNEPKVEKDHSVNSDGEEVECKNVSNLNKRDKNKKKVVATSTFTVENVEDKNVEITTKINKKNISNIVEENSDSDESLQENESFENNSVSVSEESYQDALQDEESDDNLSEEEMAIKEEKTIKSSNKRKQNDIEESFKEDNSSDEGSLPEPIKKKLKKIENKKDFIPKKMLIDSNEVPADLPTEKRVDSFFMTDGGSNYMTLAIPRPPDKLDNKNNEGDSFKSFPQNRKMRRAAKFGNETMITDKFNKKEKYNKNNRNDNDRFGNKKSISKFRFEDKSETFNRDFNKTNTSDYKIDKFKAHTSENNKKEVVKEEKIHPSWQAKKQLSSILPFKGNKIVFD